MPASPWYHRRPPCQSASPRIGTRTVVSVLREAARVNGDVEAYVEPAGASGRRSPDLRRVGPCRRRRGRLPGPPRRGQGRRGVPAAALVASTTRCSTPRCSASVPSRRGSTRAWARPRWPPSWSGRRPCSWWSTPKRVAATSPRARLDVVGASTTRRAAWDGRAGRGVARAGARRSGRRGVDERDDRPAQGGALRPRQPGRRGAGHRRAEPAGRPPALAAAVRPRGLHDAGLGRDRATP